MNLDPAPRQSKLIYLAIDAGLLVTAFIIVFFAPNPYAPLPFVSAVLCVVLAAIIGLIPFLTDYAADSAEYIQTERGRVTEQVQRLHAATESLARAAAQIKAVEEAVHKTAHAAENLPYRMQEKLAEFNETLATKDNDEREALEQELDELRAAQAGNLKTVAEKIARAAAEWTTLETANRQHLDKAQAAAAKLTDQLQTTLARLDTRLTGTNPTDAPAPVTTEPAPPVEPPDPTPETETPLSEEASLPPPVESEAPTSPALEEPKPKKPRAPRKPKPEETAEPVATSIEESPEPAVAGETPDNPEPEEASASSDGATRLLVTAYIGIGNKLFIRGDGPGLSWDKGVPMQFVSIGKWGWASHEATGPVKCKLYKNDDTPALSGEVKLEPGKHVEVTALF